MDKSVVENIAQLNEIIEVIKDRMVGALTEPTLSQVVTDDSSPSLVGVVPSKIKLPSNVWKRKSTALAADLVAPNDSTPPLVATTESKTSLVVTTESTPSLVARTESTSVGTTDSTTSVVTTADSSSSLIATTDSSSLVPAIPSEIKMSSGGRKRRGRKRKSTALTDRPNGVLLEEYEVEKIVAHKKELDTIKFYKVKWVGFSYDECTWEPVDNLRTSLAIIADYHQSLIYPGRGEVVFKSHVDVMREELSVLDDKIIEEFCRKYLTESGHSVDLKNDEVEEDLTILSRIPPFARDAKMISDVKRQLQLLEFRRRREKQLETLKTWAAEANAVSTDPAPITLYNNVDLDVITPNFHYINKSVPDFDVIVNEDSPLSCDCVGSCLKKKCCWSFQWTEPPYTKNGILRYDRGAPIFECTNKCKCGPSCGNRVLQHGRKVPVAIFKTDNGCGWGVKTLVPIKKGEFVVEYVGEIVKFDIAEHRGRIYDRAGCTYLFDLDFNDDDCPYTVDAAIYGNVSHFINHSCDPNLSVFSVWVDCLDRSLPRLGLYAAKNIRAFEELTFDYMMELNTPKRRKSDKQVMCRCNAKGCRMLVF